MEMASILLSYGANPNFQCHFNVTHFEIA
ncbi:hypothetical protein [Orientia tsutsugamushi]|nr:hypothetical protein [Orientia tsutsugamushi]